MCDILILEKEMVSFWEEPSLVPLPQIIHLFISFHFFLTPLWKPANFIKAYLRI